MTGDPFYHERAVAIGQELLAHFVPNPDMPHAFQWKHQVAGNDEGWQKVGYAQTVMRVVMEMHLEGFLGFADPAFMEHLAATFRDAVYGKFPAPYASMALRVSGEGEVSTHIYGLSGFGRWDPSHMLLDVAETRYSAGTYGLWNACYALMAVSRRGETPAPPAASGG